MSGRWQSVRLGDVVEINPDTIGRNWPYSQIQYIDISSVGEGFIETSPQRMTLAGAPSRAKRLIAAGDTVISTVRPNRRSMFFASKPSDNWVVSTGFAVIRPKKEHVNPRYLYACVFNQNFTEYLITREKGAAYPAVSPEDIASAEILLPPLPTQRAIARILGALDDKIELNRRMNRTLEGMARALFKSWFVDFDPVRAKMEGRKPYGMGDKTAALFPSRLVDSELGEIPEGWNVVSVGEIGRVICGKTPSTKVSEYYGYNVPFITIPDMHNKIFATYTQRKLSSFGAASQKNKMLPIGALCVSCIATPGLVVIASEISQTNQQINSVIPYKSNETYYWFWSFRNLGGEIRAEGSGGSVLSNLSTERLKKMKILAPSEELRAYYHKAVATIFHKLLENDQESRTLSALRDALLPKLLGGELEVDTDKFINRVTR